MRKLKDNFSFYVHIFFLYISILVLIIPFLIGIVFKLNGVLYILGYGIIYLIGFYIASWIIVPLATIVFEFLYDKIGLYGLFLFVFIATSIFTMVGYSLFNFSTKDEVRFFTELSTSPIFLWIIYVIREKKV